MGIWACIERINGSQGRNDLMYDAKLPNPGFGVYTDFRILMRQLMINRPCDQYVQRHEILSLSPSGCAIPDSGRSCSRDGLSKALGGVAPDTLSRHSGKDLVGHLASQREGKRHMGPDLQRHNKLLMISETL